MVPRFRKPKVALFSRDYQWLRSDEEVRRFLVAAREEERRRPHAEPNGREMGDHVSSHDDRE
jgi:hypothetical protein